MTSLAFSIHRYPGSIKTPSHHTEIANIVRRLSSKESSFVPLVQYQGGGTLLSTDHSDERTIDESDESFVRRIQLRFVDGDMTAPLRLLTSTDSITTT